MSFKKAIVPPSSPEQTEIYRVWKEEKTNIIVNSVAGSGKTFTGVQMCRRNKRDNIAYVAFNKHIQMELTTHLSQPNVQCMTYHSLGFRALKSAIRNIDVEENKLTRLLDNIVTKHISDSARGYITVRTRKLTSLAKQYAVSKQEDLERLVDHHGIDLTDIESYVYEYVPLALAASKAETDIIDYDDMVWLPRELGVIMPYYDAMLIDEAQDTNMSQQWLALESTDRLVVIGDPNQAIYGFRGSDTESMNRLRDELKKTEAGVVELSLSRTRRCPTSHVELAQRVVPQIQAMSDAPKGSVRSLNYETAVSEMKAGDMVICRVNAALMTTAYALIKRGIKAIVRGRDVGDGISKLIDQAQKRRPTNNALEMLRVACDITNEQIRKLKSMPEGKGEKRIGAATDRYECLSNICENVVTVLEVRSLIAKIFADFTDDGKPNHAVVLGTVHRTKGLEANRIFVLCPELIPHPMAKKAWEYQQELNLAYVAVTRAVFNEKGEGEIIWIGNPPSMFVDRKPEPEKESVEQISFDF